jgi:hypothetical protein
MRRQTGRQAECAVTGEVLRVLKRTITLRQGALDICQRNSGCSGLASRSSLRCRPGDFEAAGLFCVSSWMTVSRLVFLASAAGWLQASWSSLHQQPGNCEPAGLPCIGGRVTVSQSVFLPSADGVAIRRLAVIVCTPYKLSRCKRSCDWLACQRSTSLYSVTAPDLTGVGAAVAHDDWLVLATL